MTQDDHQADADRALGARIRMLLAMQDMSDHPSASSSWCARVTLRRFDHDVEGNVAGPHYYCNVGDGASSKCSTLDEAVSKAEPDV